MLIYFYILMVCYLPILNGLIPTTNFGEGIPDFGVSRVILILFFFGLMLTVAIEKKMRISTKWTNIICIFLAIVVASISWSSRSYGFSTLRSIFDTVFIPGLLALVGVNLFYDREKAEKYIKHITFASAILAIGAVVEMFVAVLDGLEKFRATGFLVNPNALAMMLVAALPCILWSIEKGIIGRSIGRMVLILNVAGIVCTVSRKGIAAMILVFFLDSILKRNVKRAIYCFLGFAFLGMAAAASNLVTQRFERDFVEVHVEGKWAMTMAGFDMFMKNPFKGLGFEGYQANFKSYFPFARKVEYDAHNIFITALANYGLLGFIPFMGIFLYPLWFGWGLLKRPFSDGSYLCGMAAIGICTILPFMVSGWFAGGSFYNPLTMSWIYGNTALLMAWDVGVDRCIPDSFVEAEHEV